MKLRKQHIDFILLIALISLLAFPMFELQYRYIHDPYADKLGFITETGMFKNLWAEFTNDYQKIIIYGFNIKFPVVYFGLIGQLLVTSNSLRKLKTIYWGYTGNIALYGLSLLVFILSFYEHRIQLHFQIGSILFLLILIIGILKEYYLSKKLFKNNF